MSYLPYIDNTEEQIPSQYTETVEELFRGQLQQMHASRGNSLHPAAQKLAAAFQPKALRFSQDLYDSYCQEPSMQKRPRKEQEEGDNPDTIAMKGKRHQGVDLSRYEDPGDTETLGAVSSYLHHQKLVLKELLPLTLRNQWAVNNDYMMRSQEWHAAIINKQIDDINSLTEYREQQQLQIASLLSDLRSQWAQQLNDNLGL